MLGIGAQWFQQISGIKWVPGEDLVPSATDGSLITYYLTSVLTDMGLGAEMSRIISGVNGTTYFLTRCLLLLFLAIESADPLAVSSQSLSSNVLAADP